MKYIPNIILMSFVLSVGGYWSWERWEVREYENLDACWSILSEVDLLRDSKDFESAHKKIELYKTCSNKFSANLGMRFYYHYGWLLHEEERYEEAIAAYQKGLFFQKDYAFAYWRRGLSLEALGNHSAAKRDFEKAYDIGIKGGGDSFLAALEKYPHIKSKLTEHL